MKTPKGYVAVRGGYTDTTDERADRWYIDTIGEPRAIGPTTPYLAPYLAPSPANGRGRPSVGRSGTRAATERKRPSADVRGRT